MASNRHRLTARTVATLSAPGRYPDGAGLVLVVAGTGSKTWAFHYRSPEHRIVRAGKTLGRPREMGFGRYGSAADEVSLAEAREKAEQARALIKSGKDPLEEKERQTRAARRIPTFGEMADAFVAAMRPSWTNEKHAEQWATTLRVYAAPIRDKPVDTINSEDVLLCLRPHWERRPETAGRLRGRIERVLNAAKAQGHRTGENPATWRGHLENLLPRRAKLSRGHHAALQWRKLPDFMPELRKRDGVAALALEFAILTACRSGEVRGLRWEEIDLNARIWSIPSHRMKAKQAHQVPLTPRMMAILTMIAPLNDRDGFVFPSQRAGRPLSDMSLSAVLRRMKVDCTVHGFRSSFRDWAGSATSFPRELAEEALAHVIGNQTERAYRREAALERRRELMLAWESYLCAPAGENIVPLRRERG